MAPKKNRNRRKKEAPDAEKSKSKSKSEPSTSSPLPTTSSTAANSCVLPPKIIISILSRLPVNTLVRFQRVCRQWKSLVTNQEFIKIHYNRFSEAPKRWLVNSQILDRSKLGFVPTKKKANLVNQRIRGDIALTSCKGLICLAMPLFTDRIILWNPATRLWKVLPDYSTTTPHQGSGVFSSVGFGCNEEGDDHKVVRINCVKGKKMKVYAEIYSSKSDSWEPLNVGLAFRTLFVYQTVEVSGNPVWIVHNERKELALLRFESTKMLFEPIKHPWMVEQEAVTYVDMFGDVGAMRFRRRRNGKLEGIEVAAYVNEEWVVKWNIEGGGLTRRVQVKYIEGYSWRKGKIVGRCMNGSMFEYDVKEASVRVFGADRGASGYLRLYGFEESLAHVIGMAAMDLATPVADGDGDMKKCISEGFFTWIVPREAGEIQVYYPLGF